MPPSDSQPAREAARDVEANPVVRGLARGGCAASGVVHLLIGVLVLALAFGGSGEADQSGALQEIAAVPLGFLGLWIIAVLLWALAIYHAVEALLVRTGSTAKTWGRRVSEAGQAVVLVALGVASAAIALGARPDGDETTQGASRGVLQLPGGPIILTLVGLGILAGGIAFCVMGVRRSFEQKMSIPHNPLGDGVKTLGVVGYLAKGVALAIVGVLLAVAGFTSDAGKAGALDAAFHSLQGLILGPVLVGPLLVGLVGAGFVAYGVFLFFRARYARL